ncbi:hypothetical protein DWY11_01060 [Segatella copri]|uniref:Uncharacterized protein n=1 Tax=Segatella copri TaxID=165179 RepID=A0A412HIM3_9BACT|nr:hypothetical protein DWY11_01060 [Segatella copri]
MRAQAPLADQNSGRAIASPATSLALMLRARAWEWDKDPLFARGGQGSRKICVICAICGTMLKTRNSLAISDISLIFAACKQ